MKENDMLCKSTKDYSKEDLFATILGCFQKYDIKVMVNVWSNERKRIISTKNWKITTDLKVCELKIF